MDNSCNCNLSTNQNKITQSCKLNNIRKRRQERAAYMRQYRMTNISPEKWQNVMSTREIIGQQMHLQTKKQNAMRTREIIGQQMHLQRKKTKRNKNKKNYRTANTSPEKKAGRNEYQRNYRVSSLSNFIKLYIKVHCMSVPVVTSYVYKHSVTIADQIRQSIPDIIKSPNNRESVDSKEWVCRTCHSH